MIHTKFVDNVLDFPKIQKGWQRHLGTQEYWVRPRKSGKFWFFHSIGMKMKGGQKGGARKRGAKEGAAFPNVGSDQIYHNMRL